MIEFTGHGISSQNNRILIERSSDFLFKIMNNGKCEATYNFANIHYSVDNHTVCIGIDKRIHVVEHFFSALYGLEIFGVGIEVWGEEFPIFDGSSLEYAARFRDFNHNRSPELMIDRTLAVESGNSYLKYGPDNDQHLRINMEFSHPFINTQKISIKIDRDTYFKEIAPARTFIFTTEDDTRLKNLPPYGIGITREKSYSHEPLRFTDELIRHKVLDLLGDLYFVGGKICGHIQARNTFHRLNHEFVKKF